MLKYADIGSNKYKLLFKSFKKGNIQIQDSNINQYRSEKNVTNKGFQWTPNRLEFSQTKLEDKSYLNSFIFYSVMFSTSNTNQTI